MGIAPRYRRSGLARRQGREADTDGPAWRVRGDAAWCTVSIRQLASAAIESTAVAAPSTAVISLGLNAPAFGGGGQGGVAAAALGGPRGQAARGASIGAALRRRQLRGVVQRRPQRHVCALSLR